MINNTRRNWSREERAKIVMEGMQGDNIKEVCRKYEVASGQWYRWRDAFLQKGEEGLEDHRRTGKKQNPLEAENQKLTHLVGRLTLMLEEQKKLLNRFPGGIKREW